MSLTSVLKDRNSEARTFFDERFPNTQKIVRETNALLRNAKTIRPAEEVPWGTLGTAFDYRMRYHFAVTPSEELVAYKGAKRVSNEDGWVVDGQSTPNIWYREETSLAESTVEGFFRDLDETLIKLRSVGRRLDNGEEELLLQYCVVLALFEQCFRTLASTNSPLFSVGKNPTTEDLLNLAKPHWIEDLSALTQGMENQVDSQKFVKISLNPKFAGSIDVGGADADLILDGCLLDIKCSANAKIGKLEVYQLLGYILLDYDNQYELERTGFYMARQCQSITWSINDLIGHLMGKTPPALSELRQEFKEALGSSWLDDYTSEL